MLEIEYGYQRMVARDARFERLPAWFTRVLDDDALTIVPLDGRAALVALFPGAPVLAVVDAPL